MPFPSIACITVGKVKIDALQSRPFVHLLWMGLYKYLSLTTSQYVTWANFTSSISTSDFQALNIYPVVY